MNSIVRIWTQLVAVMIVMPCCTLQAAAVEDAEMHFILPNGFSVRTLVEGVANARSMALGDKGTLFVSTRRLGKLYAVTNAFTGIPRVITMATGLDMPNGITFADGALYVVESKRIVRYPDIENRLTDPGKPEVIADELSYKGKLHAWKYIAFGPDHKLYVSIGAPCNICEAPEQSVMLRMNAEGSQREVFALGIRNSLGFDWHPGTGELWFTDNGRDMLGDDIPPDELNRAERAGLDFGFPYCHGVDIADPKFGAIGRCSNAISPAQSLDPHAAALGMRFYTGSMFPKEYRRQIFIAEHGSWNRSKSAGKTGYRISLVRLNGDEPVSYEPFMVGFMNDEQQIYGRPVDLLVAPDGALLVSDDMRGVIYTVTYNNEDR